MSQNHKKATPHKRPMSKRPDCYEFKGLGWNNVGPASQTVAQHYFTIGPMYRVIGVVAFRGIKRHPYGSQSKHGTITQFCFNGAQA